MEEAAVRGRGNPPNSTPPAHAVPHPQRVLIVEDEPARLPASLRRDDPVGATDIGLGPWRIDLAGVPAYRTGMGYRYQPGQAH